nr:reverse transcriptase domain-containing protein [Tanacetum cinerariifolium]
DDAKKHLDKFLHVTQSIKVNGVTDDALRLYLFPHSLTHHATAWFDRLLRNSINTSEQMAKMFLGKYFPPSMVTKLINEITNFRQRPDELTLRHHDTINATASGTFMKRRLEEFYDLIENMTAHHSDWDTSAQRSESSSSITSFSDPKIVALKAKMAEINKNLMRVLQVNQQVKAVTPNYETFDGPHSYNDFPTTIGQTHNVYAARAYQGGYSYQPQENSDPPVPDLRTMEELCQPSLNGRGGPIASISIQATNFGLKNDMIQQSIKVNGVTDDALHLYLFLDSLTHHATAWFDRFPKNSINTFEQMAKMFLGKYFPPSMVTKLRNEITNFRQCPDESLFEAWECYKLSIDRCPNHNMFPVTQIDTLYNGLTLRHRDTINAAAGGTFMKRRPEECYDLIENMTAHHNDWDTSAQWSESSSFITFSSNPEIVALKAEMAKINKNLMRALQVNQQVKAVTPNCETCGGPHSYNDCPATVGQTQNVYAAGAYQGGNSYQPPGASHGQNLPPAYQASGYQAPVHQPPIPQLQVVTPNEFTNFMKANDAIPKNMKTNMTSLTKSNLELKNMFGQFMKMNTASSSGSGTLPSNTVTNSKEKLKGITTRSRISYQGPTIPTTSSSLPKVVECKTEVTKDMVPPTNNGSTKYVQPPIIQTETPILNSKPVVALTVLLKKLPEKLEDPGKFLISCDFPRMAECLALADLGASINLMPFSMWNKLSLHELSPTCMTLELADRLISHPFGVAEDVFVKVRTFHFPADFVVVDFDADPRVPLILRRSFLKNGRALIDVFKGELTLRVGKEAITFNLDQTSRYSSNYNDMTVNRIDVIDMAYEEYSDFLLEEVDAFLTLEDDPTSPEVDHSYFDPEGDILLLKAFLNDDTSLPPPTQGNYLPQVRKELKIYEAKTDKSLIDEPLEVKFNPWVSLVHCVSKKGGFTIVKNEENELILTRLVTGWRVCIDYCKLNEATRKDHFPLPFMDQMLERLAGNEYYCFLDGLLGYFQISIDLKDQEKTTFTCPYGKFAYCRMPFGLCNAPGTFQRCMMAIFHDMIEKTMEVFMDDFSEKSHFMVKEGIVPSHKISKNGIEVDKAKVDVIAKLPHPTTIKGNVVPTEKKFFKDVKHYFWDDPFCSKSVWIKSSGGMFTARKPLTFSRLATMDPPGDIMAQTTPPRRFRTPQAINNDRGTHFCNDQFAKVMLKYGVTHRLATAYQPQKSRQVEVSNRGLKRILERAVGENRASWSDKLDDALWAF